MKTEPSRTLREVWALKRAVEEETRGMSAREFLEYVRLHAPKVGVPAGRRRSFSQPKAQ